MKLLENLNKKIHYILDRGENFFGLQKRPMIEFIREHNDGKKLIGVEIGVHEGINAFHMLSFLPIEKLFLIDPYAKYDDFKDIGFDTVWDPDQTFKKAQDKLKRFGDRVVWLRMFSDSAIQHIPDNLDFVYVDGNHDYEFVKKDLELYYPKMRVGGVFGGHDFGCKRLGVTHAVLEFVEQNKLHLFGDKNDWWVIKQDKSSSKKLKK